MTFRGLEKVEAVQEAKRTAEKLQEEVAEQQEQALKRVMVWHLPLVRGNG